MGPIRRFFTNIVALALGAFLVWCALRSMELDARVAFIEQGTHPLVMPVVWWCLAFIVFSTFNRYHPKADR